MDHDHSAHVLSLPFENRKVDAPPVVNVEGIGAGLDAVETKEVAEQRVGGRRHEDRVAGVGEEAEEE